MQDDKDPAALKAAVKDAEPVEWINDVPVRFKYRVSPDSILSLISRIEQQASRIGELEGRLSRHDEAANNAINAALALHPAVDLSGLTRYGFCDFDADKIIERPDGEFVKLSDVQALLSTPAVRGVGLTDERVLEIVRTLGYAGGSFLIPLARAIEREVLATKEAEPNAVSMLSGALNHARDALRFYAEQDHFVRHQPDEWDTVSGEPQNFYEDSANTATVEDGSVAKQALEDIAGAEAYASATSPAPSVKQDESDDERHRRLTVQSMADCMDMVRNYLVEMGIIDEKVAPMFIPESIAAYVKRCAAPSASQGEVNGWQPIETAPKDGRAMLLSQTDAGGAWIGRYEPVYQSGYRPDNPWFSLMLNRDYLPKPLKSSTPTHWMPLPAAPSVTDGEGK